MTGRPAVGLSLSAAALLRHGERRSIVGDADVGAVLGLELDAGARRSRGRGEQAAKCGELEDLHRTWRRWLAAGKVVRKRGGRCN